MLETLEAQLAPGNAALLIVDMQNDYCMPGFASANAGRSIDAAGRIIPIVGKLLQAARAAGVPACHIGMETKPDGCSDSANWTVQRRRSTKVPPDLCIEGSEGAAFVPALEPRSGEPVVHKLRFSGFKATDLERQLHDRGVRTAVIVGLSTNVCVESTVRDAFELGFYVVVPEDAVCSWDAELHSASLKTIDRRFGIVCGSQDVLKVWQTRAA